MRHRKSRTLKKKRESVTCLPLKKSNSVENYYTLIDQFNKRTDTPKLNLRVEEIGCENKNK